MYLVQFMSSNDEFWKARVFTDGLVALDFVKQKEAEGCVTRCFKRIKESDLK